MKTFFSLLLIANIAFGVLQWLLPYDQLNPSTRKIPVAEELKLISEAGPIVSVPETQAEEEPRQAIAQIVEEVADDRLCIIIGPFKEKTRALEVSGRYSANNIQSELKSSLEKEYLGIMVYLTGHKDRQTAVATAERLRKSGIRDYLIIKDPDRLNDLSLGVFGLKKNADALVEKLRGLKYPVKTELRYRNRTIYWLYNQQSNERELRSLLDADDIEQGINLIPRECV